ncbi:MAG: hypothetical protein IJX58_02385 [Clostridia bacterium]|nr:hypothetical protein [Clostridia bacterium]
MWVAIIISAITCLMMIMAVLFFPKVKLFNISLGSYWVVTVIGAILLLVFGTVDITTVGQALIADNAINPLKILVLFISMTILSIFLDELGFFRYLANLALTKAGASQLRLFMILYITVSVLTVFTSNDIIILSFTPFICYFAKSAKISPIPYLAAEFVAANTWSMTLIIGNPTNIYLVTAAGGDFMSYLKVMLLPTVCSGAVAFLFLYILFRNKLKQPISDATVSEVVIEDKLSLGIGVFHLSACTVILAVGSYIGIEMWLVSLLAAVSLFVCSIIISIIRKKKPDALIACLKRAPWELIPFVLSMFVMVEALNANGVTGIIYQLLGESNPIWKYGTTSFLASNLINNIPMSVLYSSILGGASSAAAIYATVVGSNLGACLTPIGALAGIMWSSILKEHELKFGYLDFLKIGVTVAVPALITALGVLTLII